MSAIAASSATASVIHERLHYIAFDAVLSYACSTPAKALICSHVCRQWKTAVFKQPAYYLLVSWHSSAYGSRDQLQKIQDMLNTWRGRLRVFLSLEKPSDHRLEDCVALAIALVHDHLHRVTHLRVHLLEIFAARFFAALFPTAPALTYCAIRIYERSTLRRFAPAQVAQASWFEKPSVTSEIQRRLTHLELENVTLSLSTNDAFHDVRALGLEEIRLLKPLLTSSGSTYADDRITFDAIFLLFPNARSLVLCPKVYSDLTRGSIDRFAGLITSIHIRGDGDLDPSNYPWTPPEFILDLDDAAPQSFERKCRSIGPILSHITDQANLFLDVRPNRDTIALTWRLLASQISRTFYARATSSPRRCALLRAFSDGQNHFSGVVTLVLNTACFSILCRLVSEMPRVSTLTIYWAHNDYSWFRETPNYSDSMVYISAFSGTIRFDALDHLILAGTMYPIRRIRVEDVVTILESAICFREAIVIELPGLVLAGSLDIPLVRELRTHTRCLDLLEDERRWTPRGELEDYVEDLDLGSESE